MLEVQQQALLAASAIRSLEDLHKRFVDDLEASGKRACDIGELSVSSAAISCSCLGHKVSAKYRPIVLDDEIRALEYNFVTHWKKDELSVLRLYLQPSGVLTRDPKGSEKLCDFNSSYSKVKILAALANALLKSPVYAPTES